MINYRETRSYVEIKLAGHYVALLGVALTLLLTHVRKSHHTVSQTQIVTPRGQGDNSENYIFLLIVRSQEITS